MRHLAPVIILVPLAVACTDRQPAGPPPPDAAATAAGTAVPSLLIAGNIGTCSNDNDEATARLLDARPGMLVFTAGDNAFPDGTAANYANCYHPSWGRHKARTRAALGNHDYNTGSATAAFDYFGDRAGPRGKGWYSLDVGTWHIVVLNDAGQYSATNPYAPWNAGSEQEQWLRADLAATTQRCILAIWHVPLFLSSNSAGYTRNSSKQILWDILYAARADVVINGQQHHYERMAPMRPDGTRDGGGIRQFIVGTGGADGVALPTVAIHPNSQVRAAVYGVLRLRLNAESYAWRFLPVAGQSFSDGGSTACH